VPFPRSIRLLPIATFTSIAVLGLAEDAAAATMSFTDIANYGLASIQTWNEGGIVAEGLDGDLGSYATPDRLNLIDFGDAGASTVSFAMAGRFRPISFDLFPDFVNTPNSPAFPNVSVVGYLGGTVAATVAFWMGATPKTVPLAWLFPEVDLLVVAAVDNAGATLLYDCAPCNSFDIDNVVLRPVPVPLPPALPLLLSGLAGFAIAGRRRTKRSQSRP